MLCLLVFSIHNQIEKQNANCKPQGWKTPTATTCTMSSGMFSTRPVTLIRSWRHIDAVEDFQVKLRALPPSCRLQSRTRWCDQKRPYLAWPNKKARISRTFPITITHLHCMQCWKEILTWSTILADCWVHQLRTTLIGAKPQSWRKGQESVVDLVVGIEKR